MIEWETKRWIRLPDMRQRRLYHGCNKAGGDIVVFGGLSSSHGWEPLTETYSFSTNEWSLGGDLALSHLDANTVYLPEEDTFLVFGGEKADSTDSKDILRYDPESKVFFAMEKKLSVGRSENVAIKVPEDFNCHA